MSAADATELDTAGAVLKEEPPESTPMSAQDMVSAPTAHSAAAESTPFTGQIVHNRDGSLVVVDADVPWVSEPDSVVDDGSGRVSSGALPPAVRSVLFIRRRRASRANRTEAGAPPGLIVDRYRVCDAGGGGGAGANVACGEDGAPEASSSAPERTNITCCVCRLCFGAVPVFAAHCEDAHGLSLEGAPLRFLLRPDAAAVLVAAGTDRKPVVSLLRFSPCPSDRNTDGATPRAVLKTKRDGMERNGERGTPGPQQSASSDRDDACLTLKPTSDGRRAVSSPSTLSTAAVSSVAISDAAPSQLDIARSVAVTSQAAAASCAASSALKTLKCPRCNWHFKYRDTLEAHLREKHTEGGSACGFCLSGQQHPRLSRGEAHDCGYKPYRCDVCHYATTTKGNLSIHIQSDKHSNNVQERRRALGNLSAPGERIGKDGETEASKGESSEGNATADGTPSLRDIVRAKLKVLSDTAAKSPLGDGGVTLGDKIAMWFAKQPDPSKRDEKGDVMSDQLPTSDRTCSDEHLNPQHIFTCHTCTVFSTDSMEELERHMRCERGSARNSDFTTVEGSHQVCLLCSYRTHLRANFLLHCQSDKHAQKQQHLLHMLEGGAGNLWQLPYLHATSPVAVRCNLCEVSAGMGVQLRIHAAEERHQANSALWAHLCRAEQAVPIGRRRYVCTLCGYSARHVLLLLRHSASPLHLGRERRSQVERQQTSSSTPDDTIFAVRDAGPNAGDDPEEMLESNEDHSEPQQMDSLGIKTNGCAGSTFDGLNADVKRFRQLDPEFINAHLPTMCNGMTNHTAAPNIPQKRCESKLHSEKATNRGVVSGDRRGKSYINSKRDQGSTDHSAKAFHNQDSGLNHPERMAVDGADQNDNINPAENSNRPYKCNACNVSYGHPQILNIHLQSASHQARASTECMESLGTEVKPQARLVGFSEPAPNTKARQANDAKGVGDTSINISFNGECRSLLADGSKTKADEVTIVAVRRAIDERNRVLKQTENVTEDEHHACKSGVGIAQSSSRLKHTISAERLSPTERESRPMKDRLLESYGLELAMHHCESRRKRLRSEAENTANDNGGRKPVNTSASKTLRANGYVCPLCQKCFSGLWIFKLHIEEIHHKYVPKELVDVHIEALSMELNRRRKTRDDHKNMEPQLTEATKPPQSEWHASDDRTSPAPSGESADDGTKSSTDPEKSRTSSPPSVPHPPVPDIQTALSLIQAAHIRYQMQQLNPLLASQMAALGSPWAAFGLSDTDHQSQQLLSLMAAQQLLNAELLWAAQAQALAQQQQRTQVPPSAASEPAEGKRPADLSAMGDGEEKRARTRISGSQLKMLRSHFELDRTPSDEVIEELGRRCGLASKVVKHWFRNTLFKERQKDKDSPYNFSVPPGAPLEPSQQERSELTMIKSDELTGSSVISVGDGSVGSEKNSERDVVRDVTKHKAPETDTPEDAVVDLSIRTPSSVHHMSLTSTQSHSASLLSSSSSPTPAQNGSQSHDVGLRNTLSAGPGWGTPVTREFGELSITLPSRSPFQQSPSPGSSSSAYRSPMWSEISPPEGQRGSGRRANRTRFTDQQVKVLQDFFEKNAYPKDEDLRHLSKVLNLGPRVIVVWFQNARQKVRKVFENQPPPSEHEEDQSSRFKRTAELNYQCNRCKMVYQRYQELVRHQRQLCYSEESSRLRSKSQEPHAEAQLLPVAQVKPTPQDNTYKCGKCPQEFDRFDRWREHQTLHAMNPNEAPSSQQNQFYGSVVGPPPTRLSHSAEEGSDEEADDAAVWDRHAQDRRLRTSINPGQLEVLHRAYKLNCTPSRETLEAIASATGLKKRVVQVWFQNARARERKSHAVRQLPVPVTYSGLTETVVKTKVTEPYLGPEVSVELVKTYSKAVPSVLVSKQNMDREPTSGVAGFHALRHPVLEARLQAPPSQTSDAPLDLSKSHASEPPVANNLATTKPAPFVAPLAVRSDIPQHRALPLIAPREQNPWSNRPATHLTSSPAASSSPSLAASSARPPFVVSNKRFRTQMSPGQVSVLRSVFAAYRMPTMTECARLGAEIGLAKRVVQVWFQNSRAKEKKRQLLSGRPPTPPPQGCDLCKVGYGVKNSLQEHLLSRTHIERVQREAKRKPSSGSSVQASGSSGISGVAATCSSAALTPLRSSAAADVRLGLPPPPPPPPPGTATEAAEGAASAGSVTASPPQKPPSLRSALPSADGASVPPFVSIGDASRKSAFRPPAVTAASMPMATSVG